MVLKWLSVLITGTAIWCIVGITMEDVWKITSPSWYMVAGFWIYPCFDYYYKAVMEKK